MSELLSGRAARNYAGTWQALTSTSSARALTTIGDTVEVRAKIGWADPSGANESYVVSLLIVRVHDEGVFNHYVIDRDTGAVVATGRERRERESWKQARTELIARGLWSPQVA